MSLAGEEADGDGPIELGKELARADPSLETPHHSRDSLSSAQTVCKHKQKIVFFLRHLETIA